MPISLIAGVLLFAMPTIAPARDAQVTRIEYERPEPRERGRDIPRDYRPSPGRDFRPDREYRDYRPAPRVGYTCQTRRYECDMGHARPLGSSCGCTSSNGTQYGTVTP